MALCGHQAAVSSYKSSRHGLMTIAARSKFIRGHFITHVHSDDPHKSQPLAAQSSCLAALVAGWRRRWMASKTVKHIKVYLDSGCQMNPSRLYVTPELLFYYFVQHHPVS